MWTDNSDPGRYAMQPDTPTEFLLLKGIEHTIREKSFCERAYWTHDIPDYHGLSEIRHRNATDGHIGRSALVIDYNPDKLGVAE